MFAQISPSSADLGETLCSLNFASRVRGIEYGPVRKQSDAAESFKLKQMAEKLRQEEKETARLNESLQLMHLKYASRENVFRALQENIRDAEQTSRNYQQRIGSEVYLKSLKKSHNNVAQGILLSKDPTTKVGGVELGPQCWKVQIDIPIIRVEPLLRSYKGYQTIGDAVGASVAWPFTFIKRK